MRGRLQFVVHVGGGGHRLDLVEHRLKLFVFGDDGLRGRLGDVRIGSEHDGDRLADEAHLLHRQDRLVVESRPVIRIGDDFDDILRGDDAEDAGHLPRCADVERFDAAVRHRAAEDLAVQHAGQPHQVGIFGAAGDLFACFEARHRAADLAAAHRVCRHFLWLRLRTQWSLPLRNTGAPSVQCG